MRRIAGTATALVVAAALAACSPAPSITPGPIATSSIEAPASGTPGASPAASPGASTPAAALVPASPVSGVLVDIDAAALSDVTGFTLRLDDGRSFEFHLGTLENGAEFPPGHLAEHLAASTPVRVFFRLVGSDLVAYRLEDAG